ncbi:hypothetical protein [Mucilaginibacter jinjuensis]|uniref:PepSY-associated transmembrane protein n=1 Tax=Mucilaginibacter jinjuensis TaxID=1176721 RepID=A0ABY7T216_9SPHI|nr:hypothetical protein [Mucilaginibacter jinjuensis]WCT10457.1 hypothetical protein PQO05_17105 [Mucilaginibacter jinjuensis]
MRYNLYLAGFILIPLFFFFYLILQVVHVDKENIKQEGTIADFISKSAGARSDREDAFMLEQYPAIFSRSYSGLNRVIAPNLRALIYEPAPANSIPDIYYEHPVLKSRTDRQVDFYIPKQDKEKLSIKDYKIPYIYLKFKNEPHSSTGYYLDVYLYAYKTYWGVALTFASLLLSILCCIGAAGAYQHNKFFLAYTAFIVVLHFLILIF